MKMNCLRMALGVLSGLLAVVNPALAQTWIQTSAPTEYWQSVASSANGTKLVAAAPGAPIYTSSDSGATWTASSSPITNWTCVASSSDGTNLVAVVGFGLSYPTNAGLIYTSADAGGTWTATSAPSTNWSGVASSSDGTKLTAVVAD
jgi:hypothetical protein